MNCPTCDSALARIAQITNLHVTGDPRDVVLGACRACGQRYLWEWVQGEGPAGGPSGERLLGPLSRGAASKVQKLMAACPQPTSMFCACPAHVHVDRLAGKLPVIHARRDS